MAEYRRADWPANEADEEHAKRLENADQRIGTGEKHLAEHETGDSAVQQEVIPFDRGTDCACQQSTAQLAIMFGFRHATRGGGGRGHLVTSRYEQKVPMALGYVVPA